MTTRNSINHGLMKSAQNYYIKGSRLNCNGGRKINELEIDSKQKFQRLI
jgi:hypothetical protein